MPRHAGPYQIVLRKGLDRKPMFYARFRAEDGSLLPWQSTGQSSKTAARAWAAQKTKRGEGVIRRRFIFSGFAEGWWTEKHDYVQGRIARGHRLTATYLVVMRGHLENHVLPHFLNTLLRTARVPDPIVQRVKGHRTQEMTEHCAHFALEDFGEVVKVQEKVFG